MLHRLNSISSKVHSLELSMIKYLACVFFLISSTAFKNKTIPIFGHGFKDKDGKELILQIKKAMESFGGVPGRLEVFEKNNGAKAFVDFAHGEDSLSRVLKCLRKECKGRLFLVFGCGGDRDPERRYGMGRASLLADEVILSNDNPRTEKAEDIIADIQQTCSVQAKVILDRAAAIGFAWDQLEADDVLLVAGKGHEQTQIIGKQVFEFSDQKVLESLRDD